MHLAARQATSYCRCLLSARSFLLERCPSCFGCYALRLAQPALLRYWWSKQGAACVRLDLILPRKWNATISPAPDTLHAKVQATCSLAQSAVISD